jgi:indole-3-glycerol phosphate synthase
MKTILSRICATKRLEVAAQKKVLPPAELKASLSSLKRTNVSFKESLMESSTGIIAEFKRRSPSKGFINRHADVERVVLSYQSAGAAAVSCLTDRTYFGGGFVDFYLARRALKGIPLLRKDFIVDEYQVYQSRAMGADVILLIAACLSEAQSTELTGLAHSLGMEVLLELHERGELSYIRPYTDAVGINNRDLRTFETTERSKLLKYIPKGMVKVSESGILEPSTVSKLRLAGFSGFLIGGRFMQEKDPGEFLKQFISYI